MKAVDVVYAYNIVKKVMSTLKAMRCNSATELKKQFAEATKIGKQLHGDDFQLTMPRLSGRKLHRSNPPSLTAEDYYRISIYDEFLSHIVAELEERFVNNPSQGIVTGLLNLLPTECVQVQQDAGIPDDLASAVELFKGDLPHDVN